MIPHLSRCRLGFVGWKRGRQDSEKGWGHSCGDRGQKDGDGAFLRREKTELHADGSHGDDEAQPCGQEHAGGEDLPRRESP